MLLFWILATAMTAAAATTQVTLPSQCACGYQDPLTLQVFTDALIVYFNETNTIDPDVFTNQDFANRKQKGWQAIYKEGAAPQNVQFVKNTFSNLTVQALEFQTDPPDNNHLVNGGCLQSKRRDIQFGSFEAAMKSATQWTGGTALSFVLNYNSSDSLDMDMMNMDDPADARVSYLVNGEYPSVDTVSNYTALNASGLNLWTQYTSVRMDWTETEVDFYIGSNKTRTVTKKDRSLPGGGKALQLKTWSTGEETYMEGPPSVNASKSYVLWVRAFFNSSATTAAELDAFERCNVTSLCLTSDVTLRGQTSYSPASLERWKEPDLDQNIKRNAGIVAGVFGTFGVIALINAFLRRTPWQKLRFRRSKGNSTENLRAFLSGSIYKQHSSDTPSRKEEHQTSTSKFPKSKMNLRSALSSGYSTPGIHTPLPAYGAQSPMSMSQSRLPHYETPPRQQSIDSIQRPPGSATGSQRSNNGDAGGSNSSGIHSRNSNEDNTIAQLPSIDEAAAAAPPVTARQRPFPLERSHHTQDIDIIPHSVQENSGAMPALAVTEHGKLPGLAMTPLGIKSEVDATAEKKHAPAKPPPTKRIDYLAGIVGVACIGVTLHHWCQTFWPRITSDYGPSSHYPKVEQWLEIFLGSYFLTQLWIGPFFLTATRFLATNYLKNGNLEDIAKKELRRAPRLFVPIIIVSGLEYFFLSLNLQADLQWLPSISWSTWPYVVPQSNFGQYLNNLVELAYAIPNYVPEIVSHYCIGVLWTIPVQLQFTYVVLAAAVLIRDIRTPWKRFGFYTVVILCGWYARSWSACHWCGLVLADLDVTYKWRPWLRARPWANFAVLTFAFVCAAGGPLFSVFNQTFDFDTYENSLHPDFSTGKPIWVLGLEYPDYNVPTLTILLFSVGLQMLVELSTIMQAILSWKPILWLHPHIMTVYLTHGFVFWTWGAWVSVALSTHGVPYWGVLLVNLVTCYILVFGLARILSPLIEIPTQGTMRFLDRWTKHEPVPPRKTLAPFGKELLTDRFQSTSSAGES